VYLLLIGRPLQPAERVKKFVLKTAEKTQTSGATPPNFNSLCTHDMTAPTPPRPPLTHIDFHHTEKIPFGRGQREGLVKIFGDYLNSIPAARYLTSSIFLVVT
jgi:hypothetical protein